METTQIFEDLTQRYIQEKNLYKAFELQYLGTDIKSKSIGHIEAEIDRFTNYMSFFSNIKHEMLKEKVVNRLEGKSQYTLDAISGLMDIQNVYLVHLGARLSYKYNWLNIRIAVGSILIGVVLSLLPYMVPDNAEEKALDALPAKIDALIKRSIELEKIASHQDSLIKIILKNTAPKPKIPPMVLLPKRQRLRSNLKAQSLF